MSNGKIDRDAVIEILLDCIERLLGALRETAGAEKAEEIRREFFGEG